MLLLAIIFAAAQTPKTFEQLELAKIEAVHGIRTFHLEMTMTAKVGASGDVGKWSAYVLRDGSRVHGELLSPDGKLVRELCDGGTVWMTLDPQKVYTEVKVDPKEAFNPKKSLLRPDSRSMAFSFDTDSQALFAADPPFKIQSSTIVYEDGVGLRRVVASAKNKKGRNMTLTQWFLPDKWIVRRFTLDGKSGGDVVHIVGNATILDLKAKIAPGEFLFHPELVEGYTKKARFPIDSGS